MPTLHVYRIETGAPGQLAIVQRPRGGDWLVGEIADIRESGFTTLISLLTCDEENELELTEERSACEFAGVEFVSCPIPDRGVPTDVERFSAAVHGIVRRVCCAENVAVHCRMGIGRSSMLAAVALAVMGRTVDVAFEKVEEARGCPVPDTEAQREWIRRHFSEK